METSALLWQIVKEMLDQMPAMKQEMTVMTHQTTSMKHLMDIKQEVMTMEQGMAMSIEQEALKVLCRLILQSAGLAYKRYLMHLSDADKDIEDLAHLGSKC